MPRHATAAAITPVPRTLFAIGVAVLVAVLGAPSSAHAVLDAFEHSWLVIGAFAAASALASLASHGARSPRHHVAPAGATVSIDGRVAVGEEACHPQQHNLQARDGAR